MFKVIAHVFNGDRKIGQMVFVTGSLEAAQHVAANVSVPVGCHANTDLFIAARIGFKTVWVEAHSAFDLDRAAESLMEVASLIRTVERPKAKKPWTADDVEREAAE